MNKKKRLNELSRSGVKMAGRDTRVSHIFRDQEGKSETIVLKKTNKEVINKREQEPPN